MRLPVAGSNLRQSVSFTPGADPSPATTLIPVNTNSPICERRTCGGFSLFELLLTLGVAAVVFGLGLPSLAFLAADKRLRTESDALFHAVHLARQQSITARRVITLCPSLDGETCDPERRWSAGWILIANGAGGAEAERDLGEPVIWRHKVAQSVQIDANRRYFSFRSTVKRATNGTFKICDRGRRAPSRAVVVSYLGRPRVAYGDSRGRKYACAE